MPPGMALIVTFHGSNYRCLEQIFMVPEGFEPSKFDCIIKSVVGASLMRVSTVCCLTDLVFYISVVSGSADMQAFLGL